MILSMSRINDILLVQAYEVNKSPFFDLTSIRSDRYLKPEILVRIAIFGVSKRPRSYTKIFRSEAYGVNISPFFDLTSIRSDR